MELTILYPLSEIITYSISQVPVTRFHPLTGTQNTFDVLRTDVSIPFNTPTHLNDVLHAETPRDYKQTNRSWPIIDEDCTIFNEFNDRDILITSPPNCFFDDDTSQHNIVAFEDLVGDSFIFHDDVSFLDTLSHDKCSYKAIRNQTIQFMDLLKQTFPSIVIDIDRMVIQHR